LITGAGRGIGAAIAQDFLAAGDNVASLDRAAQPDAAAAAAGAVRGQLLQLEGDVTDAASVEAAFAAAAKAHGPVEVLVANAGIVRDQLLMRMSEDELTQVIDANLVGALRCARRAVKSMLRLKRGRIVLIGSVVGLSGGFGQANYAASKAGLVGVARSLTHELGGRGITTNVVAPGFIETAMTAELGEDRRQAILAQVPAGRLGQVADVVAAVRWLASADTGYVSGAVIPVDGGLGMGH